MTEPAPPVPEVKRDDDLEEFDLPFFQRLALRLQVVVLEILTRITDVLLLLWRPRLLWPYLGIWWAEIRHTPYRARRTFEVVRALKAKGVEFTEEPEERFYGVDAAFRDPFGNHWRLTQPKALDQIRDDVGTVGR